MIFEIDLNLKGYFCDFLMYCKFIMTDNDAPKITLLRGTYCYPFQFQLPENIPSSFEGEYGHVRYTVKATIEKPKRFTHVTKTAFSVIGSLDLNTIPQIDVSFFLQNKMVKYLSELMKWLFFYSIT